MNPLAIRTQRVTVVLIAASLALVAPGLVGVGTSLSLAAGLVGLAGVLWWARDRLGAAGTVAGIDFGVGLRDLWIGVGIAVAIVLGIPGTNPGELQALGGLCGLLGMANYFLRPVYATLIGMGQMVRRSLG